MPANLCVNLDMHLEDAHLHLGIRYPYMLSRVKQTLSWVGDIELLREALDELPVGGSQSGTIANVRQLVLLEAGPARDDEPGMAALMERVKTIEPASPRPRTVGRKRPGMGTSSEGGQEQAAGGHGELKRPATRASRPTTRSMADKELWQG
ncbi:hypothetical protein PR003_g30496 [Phytophthora rubi]|uniref:Uncharacterized protein n=1 Tax=Phytophthora rubi TaxID=129364 RepID=A0A6A3H3U3_9STRA|nr:hypothetical protein PR001_g29418 [Phytophthora rubi]KAE8963765.1 hypothetical protein PR002_g29183 [Phytophthora rubi]KAE9271478.1 hypothetical protein PR003_g30496 [Phytophthora rubi]